MLTKDKRIRRRPVERAAFLNAEAGVFVLSGRDLDGQQLGAALARARRRMEQMASARVRPFVAVVNARGQVRLVEGGARRGGVRRE